MKLEKSEYRSFELILNFVIFVYGSSHSIILVS